MTSVWLSLLTSAAIAGPPPPVQDCTTPAYGALEYNRFSNSNYCTDTVVTSTIGPQGDPQAGAAGQVASWKTHLDTFSQLFNHSVAPATSCGQTVTAEVYPETWTRVHATAKTRTYAHSGNVGFIDGLFNYLKGLGWSGGVTTAATCSTTEIMTIGNITVNPGKRRVGGWQDCTDKYYENVSTVSSGTQTGSRSEIFQWGTSYDSGEGNWDWTWNTCKAAWDVPTTTTKPTITPCSTTITFGF